MTRIVIAPDKFKGSLTANEVCQSIKRGINRFDQEIHCVLHPLADGGDGTLDVLKSVLKLKSRQVEVKDPLFRPLTAGYLYDDTTAYIEMSRASGLELLTPEERNCLVTTSYGTGQLIRDAIEKGLQTIYLFIGGSATNDAGIGAAEALGFRFLDHKDNQIDPIGAELVNLFTIDDTNLTFSPSEIRICVVCDVKNPLYGPDGAAHVYAAQKGADRQAIEVLDEGLRNFNEVYCKKYGSDLSGIEGGGAAGGIGAGMAGLLKAQLVPGIQTVIEITGFKEQLQGTDLVITGEGKLDKQTVSGKVIHGVYEEAQKRNIPVAVVCGMATDIEVVKAVMPVPVYQLTSHGIRVEEAISNAAELLEKRAFELISDYYQHLGN